MSAFELLHNGVQHWLYDQRWEELRPVQVQAIQAILQTDTDVIVSAQTASGKTEAAFLPVLSRILDDAEGSVRALYVGPLRALINDQFRRMELLCEGLGLPVHRWHSDVGRSAKAQLVSDPGGVLLITPESIESLFINRSSRIAAIVARLDFIVIDELHVFPGSERGMHLRSLLARLERVRGQRIRRIGLSATLGDPEPYRRWLRPSDPEQVHVIRQDDGRDEIHTKIHAYVTEPEAPESTTNSSGETDPANAAARTGDLRTTDGWPTRWQLVVDLLKHHPTGINLIFANAKRTLEELAIDLRKAAARAGLPEDRILIHHGSLAREAREETEARLQTGDDCLCLCSSTLELGIDIGSAKAVGHISSPFTVASLAQRLGRSGRRRGEVPVLRQYVLHEDDGDELSEASLWSDLVRAVALLDLFRDGWCESPNVQRLHGSTLVQQIMSVLAQTGGAKAPELHAVLAGADAFPSLTTQRLAAILRMMGKAELIEQMPNQVLLLGRVGEAIVNGRDFYAVFRTTVDWSVVHGNRSIGSIPIDNLLNVLDGVSLGGQSWRVTAVHEEDLVLEVEPWPNKRVPKFSGSGGDVADRVIHAMRTLLRSAEVPDVLDTSARRALAIAREQYRLHQLDEKLLTCWDKMVTVWTWLGSRTTRTIAMGLRSAGLDASEGCFTITVEDTTAEEVSAALVKLESADLAQNLSQLWHQTPELLVQEKYDQYLPLEELERQAVVSWLDLDGATAWLRAQRSRPTASLG